MKIPKMICCYLRSFKIKNSINTRYFDSIFNKHIPQYSFSATFDTYNRNRKTFSLFYTYVTLCVKPKFMWFDNFEQEIWLRLRIHFTSIWMIWDHHRYRNRLHFVYIRWKFRRILNNFKTWSNILILLILLRSFS